MEIAIYMLVAFDTILLINVAVDIARIKKNVGDLNFLMNKLVNKLCEIIGTKDGDGDV